MESGALLGAARHLPDSASLHPGYSRRSGTGCTICVLCAAQ